MEEYEVRIERVDEAELHYPGSNEYTAVRWNTRRHDTELSHNIVHTAFIRQGEPYIGFYMLREYQDGKYIDDDSPVDGGFGKEFAAQIRDELTRAIEYLESM